MQLLKLDGDDPQYCLLNPVNQDPIPPASWVRQIIEARQTNLVCSVNVFLFQNNMGTRKFGKDNSANNGCKPITLIFEEGINWMFSVRHVSDKCQLEEQ